MEPWLEGLPILPLQILQLLAPFNISTYAPVTVLKVLQRCWGSNLFV
jgi:hypothetical protein